MRTDRLDELLQKDPRYAPEAYAFMFDALAFTQRRLPKKRGETANVRHVSARELAEGAKELALEEFGLMASSVFRLWGVEKTDDLGQIVYNLIAAGEMSQSEQDRREDFDGLFDLHAALKKEFVLALDEE
jgi:uncharacterized repeat protein (TIGR04138 family)